MPTYDYQCRSCGQTVEVIHSMLEDGPSACERCGGELRRVFHPTGIIFRGSGFYKTDSRSGGSDTGAATPSAVPAKPSDGSGTTAAGSGGTTDGGTGTSGQSGSSAGTPAGEGG